MRLWAWTPGLLMILLLVRSPGAASAGASVPAASSSPDTLRLPLEACVDRALRQGEEMRQAEAERATARARYLQARSTALPQLNLTTRYTRQVESIFKDTGGGPTFEADSTNPDLVKRVRDLEKALPNSGFIAVSQLLSSTSFASENSWNANLGLTQKLLQGGSIWGSIAAAGHAVRAADAMQKDKREDIVLNVREAYLNALLADRGVRISELGLEQAETHLQRVRARQEAGQVSEFELLQAEVERDNQVPVVMRAQSLRDLAYLELGRLCNLSNNAPFVLETPLLEDRTFPMDPSPVDTTGLVEAAMDNAGLRALEQVSLARGHAVTVASSGRYPDFSVFANLSQQAYPRKTLPKQGEWRRDINAGLMVNWNLFDGFLTKGSIEEARANFRKSRQDLEQSRELVREAVLQARWDLERSAADLHARSRTVQLARRALELANLRYEEGASSLLEVSDARIAWQLAQSNEAQARRDYLHGLARLERQTGRRLFSEVVSNSRTQ